MPWRKTKDPYKIWLSEIILQQTRIAQGLPYYIAFTEAFPTVYDLASASEEKVLKLWQGLGYYSRGRNLHASAQMIVNDFEGIFPSTYSDIIKLKGVGDYTASAIASISFNEPTAVVDGNVYRVLSRVYGIDTPINSTTGIKEFKALAQELIDKKRPADFNQAIMEFGAIHCKPQNPYCLHCIFNDQCIALQKNKISELPVKIKKTKIKHRYLNYIVLKSSDDTTIIRQRTGKGIWQGLYEFPFIETEKTLKELDKKHLLKNDLNEINLSSISIDNIIIYNDKPIIHKLSHQHLHTTFWIIETPSIPENEISFNDLKDLPVPVLIANFIKQWRGE